MTILTLSPAGAELIGAFEGFRSTVYSCPAGFTTIGYGHRLLPTEDIHRVTEGEALGLLMQDAAREAAPVGRALQVPLEQHQMDALISLAFNCGGGAIARSTLVKLINEDAPRERIVAAWAQWNKAGGRVSRGLIRRRAAELRLFVDGEYA